MCLVGRGGKKKKMMRLKYFLLKANKKCPSRWTLPPTCWLFFFPFLCLLTCLTSFFFFFPSFFDFVWTVSFILLLLLFVGCSLFIFSLILAGFCFYSFFFLENSFGLISNVVFFFYFNEVSIYTQFF